MKPFSQLQFCLIQACASTEPLCVLTTRAHDSRHAYNTRHLGNAVFIESLQIWAAACKPRDVAYLISSRPKLGLKERMECGICLSLIDFLARAKWSENAMVSQQTEMETIALWWATCRRVKYTGDQAGWKYSSVAHQSTQILKSCVSCATMNSVKKYLKSIPGNEKQTECTLPTE